MAKTVRKNKELHCIGQDIEGCDMKFYEPKDIFPIKKDILFEGKYLAFLMIVTLYFLKNMVII